jgi:tetratricopeptide (TPR) repeat protein
MAPTASEAYYNRGFAKVNLQDFPEAIIDFTTAIDFNPEFAEAFNNRGLSHIMLGDRQNGCADLQKAAELGFVTASQAMAEYCN